MEIGNLQIPRPEIDDEAAFVNDRLTQLYLAYSRLIESEDVGTQVLAALGEDPRVQALDGYMISNGNNATGFEIKTLAMWFLWAIHEYGQDIAEKNLNTFLYSDKVSVINTLWVLGIEVEKTLDLGNGYRIESVHKMPNSREKQHYLKRDVQYFPHRTPKPKAAITYTCQTTKAVKGNETFQQIQIRDEEFWNSSRRLSEIALLLNAIDGVSCIPYFSTSYALPDMPIGMFGASGGGSQLYDIIGRTSLKLSEDSVSEIRNLVDAFGALPPGDKLRMSRALSRLSQAKRRYQIEDKILDLCIALEMALLDDNENNDQLSQSFRLRGSWLIGKDGDDRHIIYGQLRDIYKYRSQVAHSGALCKNDGIKIDEVRKRFQEFSFLTERIIRHLIYNGHPEWSKLILGTI
ncbi:MAG: hypothetical protein WCH07_09020 [Deltaproteobacteria bacterium]